MQQLTRYLHLPMSFDELALQRELACLVPAEWISHYNAQGAENHWHCQALRSPDGHMNSILAFSNDGFVDTPLMARCAYFRHVVEQFRCEKSAVRLMALAPGGVIAEHADPGTNYEDGLARLHIPVITHPDVLFWLNGEPVHFSAATTWYMNANCRHRVENNSPVTRIHLVLDCIPNEWLHALFLQAGFIGNAIAKYGDPNICDENIATVIQQLRGLHSAAADDLVRRYELIRVSENQ